MFNQPVWYVTPKEFADLVVETMEELEYFKSDEIVHPEDLYFTMNIVSESLAKGMSHAGKKVWESEKKNKKEAVMMPKDIMKKASHVLPDDPEYPPK